MNLPSQRATLFDALVAGGLAMVLGLLALPAYYLTGDRHHALAAPAHIPGSVLTVVEGAGRPDDDHLSIDSLSHRGQAVLATELAAEYADAGNYQTLRIDLDAGGEEPRLALIWGAAGRPAPEHRHDLPDGEYRVSLEDLPGWEGRIGVLGLVLAGMDRDADVTVERLVLLPEPPGVMDVYNDVLGRWLAFEGIHSRSAHFIKGGGDAHMLSAPIAAASWLGLALVLLWGVALLRGRRFTLHGPLVLFLVAWLALDLRWQSDLQRQSGETRAEFGGIAEERRTPFGTMGEELLQLLDAVKSELADDARVMIVARSPDNPLRPYARYRLLPLLSQHSAGIPDAYAHRLRTGDAVLVLGQSRTRPGSVQSAVSPGILRQLPHDFGPREFAGPGGRIVPDEDAPLGLAVEATGEGDGWHGAAVHPALVAGYYQATFTLRGVPEEKQPLYLRVVREGDERQVLAERRIRPDGGRYAAYALSFLMTGQGQVHYEVGQAPAGTRSGRVRLDAPADQGALAFLAHRRTPPFIVVRPLERNELGALFQVQ